MEKSNVIHLYLNDQTGSMQHFNEISGYKNERDGLLLFQLDTTNLHFSTFKIPQSLASLLKSHALDCSR